MIGITLYKNYICIKFKKIILKPNTVGGVAERLKASVLKTDNGATHSWVRIPPPPPSLSLKVLSSFETLLSGIFLL